MEDLDNIPLLEESASHSEVVHKPRVSSTIHQPSTPRFVFVVTFLSAIGGFLFGYDTGVVSGATLPIKDQFNMDTLSVELFVSITIGGAALFAVFGGFLNDRFGRKPTTLVSSFVFFVGSIVLAAAQNKAMLLAGRFIVGAAIGLASMTVPVYISEASPTHLRGLLVSLNVCFVTGGQLTANLVAGAFCTVNDGWRWMLGLAAAPAMIQLVGMLFMPESPRWLIKNGKHSQARKVLLSIRGAIDISEEFEAIKEACDKERAAADRLHGQSVFRMAFTTQSVRRALLIGCALQIFQQISGINTIMYYSASIIEMAGVRSRCQAIWLAAATSTSNFLFTFGAVCLVERVGRRKILLCSMAGVICCLVLLGATFQLEDSTTPVIPLVKTEINDRCSISHSSCLDCVKDTNCGFCYKNTEGLTSNYTCLTANTSTAESSLSGDCNHITPQSGFIYSMHICPSPYSWLAVIAMIVYLGVFSLGFASMPWTINSEIYPLWARSFGNSMSALCNWLFNLLVSLTFLSLTETIGKPGTFYLYTGLTVIGFLFFLLVLPESRGKTLEEMESLFSGPWIVIRGE